MADNNPLNRSRRTLLLIMALFLVPIMIAWYMNFGMDGWRPAATSNQGDLVQPARPLDNTALLDLDGAALDAEYFQRRWTFVYIGDPSCTPACQNNLYMMRQVRLTQDRDISRIQRLMVLTRAPGEDETVEPVRHYPGLQVAIPSDHSGFMAQFSLKPGEDVGKQERIYLVDPLGNLMMSYENGADPKGIIKDLERLLKASYIG